MEGHSDAGPEAGDDPPAKRAALAPETGAVYRELGQVLGEELAREDAEETAALRTRCAELEREMDAMREARETGPERALQEEREAAARRINGESVLEWSAPAWALLGMGSRDLGGRATNPVLTHPPLAPASALEAQVAELRKGSAEGALEQAREEGWVDGEGAKALREQGTPQTWLHRHPALPLLTRPAVHEAEAHAAALQRTALALESLSGVTVDAVKQSTWGELEACEAVEAPQGTHAEEAVSEVQLSMRNAEEGRGGWSGCAPNRYRTPT